MRREAYSVQRTATPCLRCTHNARRTTQHAGFTLIELVIGMAVLITALLGLLGVFIGIHALNESARNQTIATHLADRVMEEIRNSNVPSEVRPNAQAADDSAWVAWAAAHLLPLSDANLTSSSVDVDPPFEGNESEPPWSTTADPLRIQVRVNWVERGGRNRVTYVESLITQRN